MSNLDYDRITDQIGGFVMVGDMINTHCGIGYLAWKKILRTRLIEHTTTMDEIELTLYTEGLGRTKMVRFDTVLQIIPADQARG